MPSTGDQQRVEQADEEDAAVGVGLAIGDQRLVDAEARGIVEKAKPAGDLLRFEIGLGVDRELVAEPDDRDQHDELIERAADFRIVVEGGFARPLGSLALLQDRGMPGRVPGHRRSSCRSPDRRRVLDAALGPEPVEAAADAELGAGADIALEHLAVVADVLDDAHDPVLGQAELLADSCPRRRAAA